ncbi:hypothetical protein NMG60_11004365 [Bertholletia excelsa]
MEFFHICFDLIFEILTRVPLKSIDRFKSVSKNWQSLMYNSFFLSVSCQRTNTFLGCIIQRQARHDMKSTFISMDQSQVYMNLSLEFLPRPFKIEASSSQGLLCCVTGGRRPRFGVCKPSTRQWQPIPNPKMRHFTDKVAIIVLRSDPLRYKIVRLSWPKHSLINYCKFPCEVFDSDRWTWRQLDDILLPARVLLAPGHGVVSGTTVYWLLTNNQVLEFDCNTGTYTVFGLPASVYLEKDEFRFWSKKLIEYEGRLGFVCKDEVDRSWLLWVRKNYEWGKQKQFIAELVEDKEPLSSLVAFCGTDVAIFQGVCGVFFYWFQSSSLSEVKIPGLWLARREVFPFRSDLEPVELRQ